MSKLPSYKEMPIGLIVTLPGSSAQYLTGDWRTFKPVKDKEKCTQCGFCWLYCPEGAFKKTKDGDYEVDLTFCKGCGICARECPVKALVMVEG